jgi:mannitol operon transcriptional antiterminator
MSIKSRERLILEYLNVQIGPTIVNQIAKRFNVSSRTIRKSISALSDTLKSYGITIVKKPNVGVYLSQKIDNAVILRIEGADTATNHNYGLYLTQKSRMYVILFSLLKSETPHYIKDFEVMTGVSRTTVKNDLDSAQQWLSDFGISLLRRPNYGVSVEGEEIKIRNALRRLFEEVSKSEQIEGTVSCYGEYGLLYDYVDRQTSGTIEKIVLEELGKSEYHFTDYSNRSLVFHATIALKRIKNRHNISFGSEKLQTIKNSFEFEIAKNMADRIEESLGVAFIPEEVCFLALHIMGLKINTVDRDAFFRLFEKDNNGIDLLLITEEMIRVAQSSLDVYILDDIELLMGLAVHNKVAIFRLMHNMPIVNPLLDRIKNLYPDVYSAAQKAAMILCYEFQLEVNEDEIGYIAIHIGGAVERNWQNSAGIIHAAVLCLEGIGTSHLLASRLSNHFSGLRIEKQFSLAQMKDPQRAVEELAGIDLIISTVPVTGLTYLEIPSIVVDPIVSEADLKRIEVVFTDIRKTNRISNSDSPNSHGVSVKRILDIVEKNFEATSRKAVERQLNEYLNSINIPVTDNENYITIITGRPQYSLVQLLDEKVIEISDRKMEWQTAVEEAGKILLDSGYVTESYVMEMRKIIERLKPYVAIAPHLTLLHANPQNGVLCRKIGLLVTKNGVNYGHRNDPVYLHFVLAPTDTVAHLPALTDIMTIANNREFIESVCKKKTPKEIIKSIKAFLGK